MFDTNGTKLANLVDPEVMGNLLDKKLIDAIKLAPLAVVDTTLVGQAGSTIKLPQYAYIGDATVVTEASDIPIRQLTQTSTPVEIYKVGSGVQISDEAVLSGYGDPLNEAADQIVKSIASTQDNKLLKSVAVNETNVLSAGSALDADDVSDALTLFGEDIDGAKVLLCDGTLYSVLRKASNWLPASEISAEIIIKGAVGEIYGCQVVVTNRITDGNAYIIKPGALGLFMKRDTLVESDRDIVNKSTVITADKHFATYLIDSTKAVSIVKQGNPLPYDKTKTYAQNDIVIHDGEFYKANQAISTAEEWTAAHWDVVA